MTVEESGQEPPRKRARLEGHIDTPTNSTPRLPSLTASISPPLSRNSSQQNQPLPATRTPVIIPSPFQLTHIQDLSEAQNIDTVSLKDILGDPLIKECWEFNYLHDIDLLMGAFDEDVRDLVQVHVVHGFWKQEQAAGLKIQAERYKNVTLHCPYMSEMFGTHHTKMIVLLRHDDLAQIIIHTANLIQQDWRNMTQAVWRSPLLPLSSPCAVPSVDRSIGSGTKFKIDFLNYLRAYDVRKPNCKSLIEQLEKYDFSQIRGALIGSVPGRHDYESDRQTQWGWPALKHVLNTIPSQTSDSPEIAVQVSSIATLGVTDNWLSKTLFGALSTTSTRSPKLPKFKIIFPTPDEIRRSLDGYKSGGSIHTKTQTPAQQKQLEYIKPMLHHWAGDGDQHASERKATVLDAARKRAAPHIKTYIRFADAEKTQIDWALVTSANVSKQAWGEAINKAGEVRIASFELGVLVWPGLFGGEAKMVPTFRTDMPVFCESSTGLSEAKIVVGFRMPYDVPLVKYSNTDLPWCASADYLEPDWMGMKWQH